jgi:hypothetical protein
VQSSRLKSDTFCYLDKVDNRRLQLDRENHLCLALSLLLLEITGDLLLSTPTWMVIFKMDKDCLELGVVQRITKLSLAGETAVIKMVVYWLGL